VVKDAARADDTALAIDARFANSAVPTRSEPIPMERSDAATAGVNVASVTRRVALVGLFMILLLTGHGMAQSVRERLSEFAVMKTVGYSDAGVIALVFAEALAPMLLGAMLGLVVRPEFRIVAGRMFRPGQREMIVGAEVPGQFLGVGLGDKVEMPDGPWPVVGVFRTNDDVVQSELVADSDTVMAAMRNPNYSSVIVRLAGPDGFAALKRAITTNPSLSVTVERQSDYYNRRSAEISDVNDALVYGVSLLLGFGALLAAVNILYSAVVMRRSEIATLRALGFGAAPVALAVASEALLLSLAGG
jgi:ABC-type antimicrobial peptide transport system permease subunit